MRSAFDHAFLFSGGTIMDLGTLGGNFSGATAINISGQAVGSATLPGDDVHGIAFLYSDGPMADLGEPISGGHGINSAGQVVGVSVTKDGEEDGFCKTPRASTIAGKS